MIEDPNKKDDTLDATARDYLGQPSPLAFKNQPALPSGGGSIGVGAGPNTTAGGTGVSGVKRDAAFQRVADAILAPDPTAGGSADASGEGALGDPGAAGITGFDSTTAGIGLNAASLALGFPGAFGLATGLATGVPAATGVPSAATAVPSLGKVANTIMGPASDLTLNSTEGPMTVNTAYTGFFDALMNAISGKPNFTVVNARGETVAAPPSATPGFTEGGPHPAFGTQGFNAPSQSPSPYGDTPSIVGQGRGDTPDGTGTGGGGDKVVCTAMNHAYGFGAFRNAVWLAYAREHLTPAHQKGYHWWGKPMVRYAYGGASLPRRLTRAVMEHVARHRTADLWREMRGGQRHTLGRAYRAILEPLCFVIGRWA